MKEKASSGIKAELSYFLLLLLGQFSLALCTLYPFAVLNFLKYILRFVKHKMTSRFSPSSSLGSLLIHLLAVPKQHTALGREPRATQALWCHSQGGIWAIQSLQVNCEK